MPSCASVFVGQGPQFGMVDRLGRSPGWFWPARAGAGLPADPSAPWQGGSAMGRLAGVADARLYVAERGERPAFPLLVFHGGPGVERPQVVRLLGAPDAG